jgi:hypothetical protein
MVKEELLKQIKRDFLPIIYEKTILGILLFGSYSRGNQTSLSDIDLCVVAPEEDPIELYTLFSTNINLFSKRYDIKFFSKLPLYMQIRVIEEGIVVYSPDELELYEYFYHFRKLWADQKHRQQLSRDELLSLLE